MLQKFLQFILYRFSIQSVGVYFHLSGGLQFDKNKFIN